MSYEKATNVMKKIGGGEIFLFLFFCKGPLATWCDLHVSCLYYSTQRVSEISTRIDKRTLTLSSLGGRLRKL